MKRFQYFSLAVALLFLNSTGFSQLKLGYSPASIQKSSILELESSNQGLLFPRLTDTAQINTMNPPDGMVIYFTPARQIMIRSNGYWQAVTFSGALNNYWSTAGNTNGSSLVIGNVDNYSLRFITNNIERMRIANTGNIGIGTSSFDGTNPEKLLIDAGTTTSFNLVKAKGNINNYLQFNIQNQSNGNTASSDMVATADNGTESVNYVDLGINSSAYSSSGILGGINNGYLYSTGNDFIIGNSTSGKNLVFFTGGLATTNERLRIDSNGNVGIGITNPTATLHLKAGTAGAYTAPLKFTAGTNLAITEAGAIEFNGTHLYFTATNGGTRYQLDQQPVDTSNISSFSSKVRSLFSGSVPITYSNGLIGITQATTAANGYLSSTDWNTFNNKVATTRTINTTAPLQGGGNLSANRTLSIIDAAADGVTKGAATFNASDFNSASGVISLDYTNGQSANGTTKGFLTSADWTTFNNKLSSVDTTSISNFSAKVRSLFSGTAPITYSNGLIGITLATASTNGYLSSTDWNIFNNKLSSIDTSGISNFYLKVRNELSAGTGISYDNNTGTISNSGVISLNGNTGALTMDTSYISNFYSKVRSLHSGTAPITYDSLTGAIGITQATTSANGYLDSTDWNKFNNKINRAGDTMSGFLILNADPTVPMGAATKKYVDDLASGITYIDAIMTPDLKNDMLNTPPTPVSHESYIVGASPTGAWSGLAGHVVYWNGSAWVDILNRAVQAGDRFGVMLHDTTQTAGGGLTGKNKYVVQIVNPTPGSITYTSTAPTLGMTVFDSGAPNDGDYGNGYNYNGSYWNQFISSTGYTAGSGLTLSGNSFSIGSGQVTNTMLAGSITASNLIGTDIATVGTITSGVWNGTPIEDNWINSASAWNAKLSSVSNLAGDGVPVYKTTSLNDAKFKRLVAGAGMTITDNTDSITIGTSGLTSIDTSDISNFYLKVRSELSGGTGITYNTSTGMITNSGVISLNGNTGALTMDTSYINNFYLKTRSLFSGIAPITYNSTTGTIDITQASSSANGYLSSTDWNLFNNKVTSQWITAGNNIYYNSGNVGIGTSSFNGTNPERLIADAGSTGNTNYQNVIIGKGNTNSYAQLNIQNTNAGTNASSDIVATADNGNETNNYVDLGINSSGNSSGIMGSANDAYLYNVGGNFLIGSGSSSNSLVFLTGGQTQSVNERMRIDSAGRIGIGITTPSAILHLRAGTATAYTAPLKFTAGTSLAITEAGAIEFNGTHLYFTATDGGTRYQLDQQPVDTSSISNFSAKVWALFSGAAPITYSNGLIGITQATTSTNGYLSSTDWNTFNNKVATTRTINTTAPLQGGGNLSANRTLSIADAAADGITKGAATFNASDFNAATGVISIDYTNGQSANGTTKGFLTSADWTTFNNKLSSVDTTSISNFSAKVRSLFSGIAPITYSNGLIGITQATTSTDGYLSSADWNTFNNKLSSIDTTNISNFSVKVRSLFSGTAPITYSNGLIGITQATTSTNGYLSSTDWNTFNGKANSFTNGNLTETGSGILTITGGTGSVIGTGTSIQVKQATTSQSGYLSNTDWNTFNNKLSSIDTTNISSFSIKVRSLFSGTAPITYSNGLIGISQATTSTNGYLSSADWNTFNNKLSSIDTTNISNFSVKVRSLFSGTAPITYSNGLIGISQATTSTNGYLSSADWNTFNTKGSGSVTSVSVTSANGVSGVVATPTTTPAITLTLGAITPTSVAATGTVTGSNLSGTNTGNVTIGTANGLSIVGQALSMSAANTSTTGALTSADWNTFNNKLSSIDTTNISSFSVKVRSLFSGTSPITYSNGLIGISQATTSTNGYLSSLDWNTFNNKLSSVDTTNISNFSVKVRSLFSGTAPITYANGLIGISLANTSTNGYLSSADWNTFNTKGSGSVTSVSVTSANGVSGVVATPTTTPAITLTLGAITPTSVAATGTVTGSNLSGTNTGNVTIGTANGLSIVGQALSMSAANTSTTGALTSADWNTFNNKLSSIDTTNISNFSVKVRSLFSGTAPITYSNGLIGISQATTSTNGYLSSGDWNTFNNKANASSINGTINYIPKFTASGTIGNSTLQDNGTTISTTELIKYNSNYGSSFDARTLVDKNYVDSVKTATIGSVWTLTGNAGINPVTNFIGTTDSKSLRFRSNNIQRMIIDSIGRTGIGVTDPANPLVVKDTLEIRRTGTASELLFSNTAGSGDFRIGSDGSDIFWQGGGGRNLQMGSYWTTILAGDREDPSFPSYINGTANTGVLIPAQRDASVPLAIQANSATQTANLTEWRNSAGTVLDVFNANGNVAIGTSTFDATNPEKLLVNAGTTTSVNAIAGKGTINNYFQLNIQNQSNGTNASSDVVATADNGNETTNYVDMGINSSGNTSGAMGGADDAYLYNNGNNFLIGTSVAAKSLIFLTGGTTQATNERMRIDGTGNVGISTTTPVSKFDVNGSTGYAITTTTTNLTLDATNHTVILTGGTPVITLPSAASSTRRVYIIVNQTGAARTISAYLNFSAASVTTVAANSSITVQSNGTSWYRIQ